MNPPENCDVLYFRQDEADEHLVRLLHQFTSRLDIVQDRSNLLLELENRIHQPYDMVMIHETTGLVDTESLAGNIVAASPSSFIVSLMADESEVARNTRLRAYRAGCARMLAADDMRNEDALSELFAEVSGMKTHLERYETYREVVEHSRDIITILDDDGLVQYESPSVEEVLGYRSEVLEGKNPFEFIHPDDRRKVMAAFLKGRGQDRAENDIEYRFMHADGDWRVLESRARNVLSISGSNRLIISSRDVSSRHDVIAKLKRQEGQLAEAQRITHIGSWEWRMKDNRLQWSDEMYQIYGFHPGSPLTIERYMEAIHPEDRESVRSAINSAVEYQGSFTFNHRILRNDGSIRTLYCQGEVLVDDLSKTVGMFGTGHDVTESLASQRALQESEDLFRNLVDLAPDAIIVLSREGQVLDVNTSACILFGATRKWLLDQTYPQLKPPERREQARKTFLELRIGEEHRSERVILNRQGERIPIEHRIRVISREKGEVVLLYIRDISERLAKERALRRLSRHQEDAIERERTRISREVHDVLGQSLTALGMDVSWLARQNGEDPEMHERLGDMKERVDETLETARRIAHDLRPGILDDFGLAAAIDWQAHQFAKRAKLSVHMGTMDHFELETDIATTIFRVFQELLTNIARHANASMFEVGLTQNGRNLVLTVRDDGKGFDQKNAAESSSLGLMGIRERLVPFDGRVDIESGRGSGTRIEIIVPVREPELSVQP